MRNTIFSLDSAKAVKAQSYGWLNGIHYMAPATMAGVGNLCPHASPACAAACLGWTSGQAGMVKHDEDLNNVRRSRIEKAVRFMRDRQNYLGDMCHSVIKAERKASHMGLQLCLRLNGSTDIAWEGMKFGDAFGTYWHGRNLYTAFPTIQFVDYTKSKKRALAHARGELPANLHLTFSRSETNEADCLDVLNAGGNVAVVFATIPETWHGFPVIDGDAHDLRHLDPKGVVVGLSPKGLKAKRDASGFVVR
jgi:hypothetical protein